VAYLLQLFARSGEPVAQRAAPALLEAASGLDPDLLAVHDQDGIGVAGYDVFRRPDGNADTRTLPPNAGPVVRLTVVTGCRPAEMARYIDRGGPAELLQCDTQIELILTGRLFTDADWMIIRAICRAAADLWHAALWDESDGFAVTIDDVNRRSLDGGHPIRFGDERATERGGETRPSARGRSR
jgi:hypothetical protein